MKGCMKLRYLSVVDKSVHAILAVVAFCSLEEHLGMLKSSLNCLPWKIFGGSHLT